MQIQDQRKEIETTEPTVTVQSRFVCTPQLHQISQTYVLIPA